MSVDSDDDRLHWTAIAVDGIGRLDDWSGLLLDSRAAAAHWDDESLDLIMLDTSHEYEQTVAELAAWVPKLKHAGLLWAHDYEGEYEGCRRAIDECVEAGRLRVALDACGLGIVLDRRYADVRTGRLDATTTMDDDAGGD